jgi:hypothetical protein
LLIRRGIEPSVPVLSFGRLFALPEMSQPESGDEIRFDAMPDQLFDS